METKKHFIDEIASIIQNDNSLEESVKAQVMRNLTKMRGTKVHILITGATGCGKSSTINALFTTEKAKVGQGVDPETMDIDKYELNNIVLYDSPGLGDGKDADLRHAKNIVDKLYEKDSNGNLLIDLVLVILDGSSRDLGTSFQLINEVIIPNLGDDRKRLLVAINQADVAMKGRHWNHTENKPESELDSFLNDKVDSTRRRIKEATGVDVEPIYYSAGYKDGNKSQRPYNLSKLMLLILQSIKQDKRFTIAQDINKNKEMWKDDDRLQDYRSEIRKSLWESIKDGASSGSEIGGEIGGYFGKKGASIGRVVGGIIGAVASVFSSIFDR